MDIKEAWDDSLPQKGAEAWERATVKKKEAAMIHATQFLDTLPYKGEPRTSTQALAWPRKNVFRDDGAPITGVPEEIKIATGLVASFILAKIPFDVPALAWVFTKIGHLLEDGVDLRNSNITWH